MTAADSILGAPERFLEKGRSASQRSTKDVPNCSRENSLTG